MIIKDQSPKEEPDTRIFFLLLLALLLFLFDLFSQFKPYLIQKNREITTLAIGSSGLILEERPEINEQEDKSLPPELAPFYFKPIKINLVSAEMIKTIPGIGRVIASSIVAHRKQIGFFTRPEDLLQIRGIGKKRMKKLAKHVSFEFQ